MFGSDKINLYLSLPLVCGIRLEISYLECLVFYQFLQSVNDINIFILIIMGDITGMEPTFRVYGTSRRFWIFIISFHNLENEVYLRSKNIRVNYVSWLGEIRCEIAVPDPEENVGRGSADWIISNEYWLSTTKSPNGNTNIFTVKVNRDKKNCRIL